MNRRRRPTPRAQLQRALRRSRGRMILAWLAPRWLSLAGSVLLFGASLALLLATTFHVEQVIVRHESASAHETVTRATQLSHVVGQNIFLVNTQRVAQEVATIPSVLQARVMLRLPNIVEIEIVEREPIARWQAGGAVFLVDDQGLVMAEVNDRVDGGASAVDRSLLTIKDTTGRTLQLGERVDQRTLLAARELVKALPSAGTQVRDVEFSSTGLVFITDAGWRVIFGNTEALNAKLANLAAVVDYARQGNLKIATLDLRPKDRPFYQLAP